MKEFGKSMDDLMTSPARPGTLERASQLMLQEYLRLEKMEKERNALVLVAVDGLADELLDDLGFDRGKGGRGVHFIGDEGEGA
jgi:hypothetical protein